MKFEGTRAYVATDDLKLAVNAAITLDSASCSASMVLPVPS